MSITKHFINGKLIVYNSDGHCYDMLGTPEVKVSLSTASSYHERHPLLKEGVFEVVFGIVLLAIIVFASFLVIFKKNIDLFHNNRRVL